MKKRDGKKEDIDDNGEVVVSNCLMVWDVNDEVLKEKRGKRLAVQVNNKEMTRNTHSHCKTGKKLSSCLGQTRSFFPLVRYKEELLKHYKRITFFLCTTEHLEARNDSGMKGKEICSDHNSYNNQRSVQ